MSLFGSIDISASGIDAAQTWIDTSSGNIANADDAVRTDQAAYQAQDPFLVPDPAAAPGDVGQGVSVRAIELGPADGVETYDPSSPLADAEGEVRYPEVDMADQLVHLVEAQNAYQANAAAVQRATAAYQSALALRF